MTSFDLRQFRSEALKCFVAASDHSSVDPLLAEIARACQEAEKLLQRQPDGDRSLIACGPGCGTCCVVNVSVSFPEGIAIARNLRQRDAVEREKLTSRLEKLWRDVRGLDDEERLALRRKCAFLDERGSCTIYSVRPLVCRSVTSTDPENCRDAVAGPALGSRQLILMHQLQQQVYESLFSALVAGLEQSGLDGRSFQLTGLVRYLLTYPDREVALLRNRSLNWEHLYP